MAAATVILAGLSPPRRFAYDRDEVPDRSRQMTEAEWESVSEPTPIFEHIGGRASDRKLRLFACACCRRHWHLLIDDRSRAAVEVAERLADGSTTEPEYRGTRRRQRRERGCRGSKQGLSDRRAFPDCGPCGKFRNHR
jgi:hypothetical protein